MRRKSSGDRWWIFESVSERNRYCRIYIDLQFYGLILAAHEPFESTEAAIEKESDIHSDSTVVKRTLERKKVEDTDVGRHLKEQIADLEVLLAAYRSGVIAERL